mmetsp:Transcript_29105/g.42737  ORF Transcript_29105/g.42737 Transcript_29105/m.42737 type:complete len:200 (+) Transcript_29105:1011-1610(+)
MHNRFDEGLKQVGMGARHDVKEEPLRVGYQGLAPFHIPLEHSFIDGADTLAWGLSIRFAIDVLEQRHQDAQQRQRNGNHRHHQLRGIVRIQLFLCYGPLLEIFHLLRYRLAIAAQPVIVIGRATVEGAFFFLTCCGIFASLALAQHSKFALLQREFLPPERKLLLLQLDFFSVEIHRVLSHLHHQSNQSNWHPWCTGEH